MTNRISVVTAVAAADPAEAAAHFADKLRFETDCADLHGDLAAGAPGIVVVDVRSAAAYAEAHVPGARSLPHADIDEVTIADLPRDAVIVTYCWGPHCNGATRAAATLAALGFQGKEMLGGIAGWRSEDYVLVPDANCRSVAKTESSPAPA
jgi:rhodanese-related sulfurtransferase